MKQLKFLIAGSFFGIMIVKSEALSWFRIQEMFRFQSIHMFGIFGTAVLVGAITVLLIKKYQFKTIDGQSILIEPKPLQWKGNLIGGILFGIGWAITGLCVAPVFALLSTGYLAAGLIFIGTLAGVFSYAIVRDRLPH